MMGILVSPVRVCAVVRSRGKYPLMEGEIIFTDFPRPLQASHAVYCSCPPKSFRKERRFSGFNMKKALKKALFCYDKLLPPPPISPLPGLDYNQHMCTHA